MHNHIKPLLNSLYLKAAKKNIIRAGTKVNIITLRHTEVYSVKEHTKICMLWAFTILFNLSPADRILYTIRNYAIYFI